STFLISPALVSLPVRTATIPGSSPELDVELEPLSDWDPRDPGTATPITAGAVSIVTERNPTELASRGGTTTAATAPRATIERTDTARGLRARPRPIAA